MGKREFEYYAFISYCRADEKWAKWIQHKLETYRFPTALRREYQSLPRKIFPIFRDKTDLSSGVLWEQLKYQLEESEYLIVICSPESASSTWVGQEITYFRELGRGKNIIPLIVDGEPHAADEVRECYHPSLQNDSDGELLGVSVSELGRNKAALRVIASMMHLRYDQLLMRDARRTRRRRAVAAGLFMAILVVFAGVIWYEIPHHYYYWSYVYQNELPVGLVEVSRADRKTAHDYYKIVKRRNQIIRLERVNSAGTVTDGVVTYATDEYPVIEFTYNDNGLDSVIQKDSAGDVQMMKSYSQNLGTVDFKNPRNDEKAGMLPSNLGANSGISFVARTSGTSGITRQKQEYDDNGYLIQVLYMRDSLDTPACDGNGIYGKQYIRDDEGKILQIINLGSDYDGDGKPDPLRMQYGGNATSVVYTDYEYDRYGRIIRCSVYDADRQYALDERNVFCWEDIYDDLGRVIQERCLDYAGNLTPNLEGISQYVMEYSEEGRLKACYRLNGDGTAAYNKELGIYRTEFQNDANGRVAGVTYYDADGSRMVCSGGYASFSCQYDTQGHMIEQWYYDVDGELTCAIDDANEAGCAVEFLDEDSTIKFTYYDKEGKIAINKYGYAMVVQKCNEQGLLVEVSFYDAEDNPVRARDDNAASVVYGYDNFTHLTSISYFDENGSPCSNKEGIARESMEYKDGNRIAERYYDTDGKPCNANFEEGNYAEWIAEYNSDGCMNKIRYYDSTGSLCSINRAYEKQMEYDERGNCIRYTYCDYLGHPLNNRDGYAVKELAFDEKGMLIYECYRDQDGSFVTGQSYANESEYDKRGNLICAISYTLDEDGNETHIAAYYEYDERGNLLRQYYEDSNGSLHADDKGIAIYEWTYDERNIQVTETRYDEKKKLVSDWEICYDTKNKTSDVWFYNGTVENGTTTRSLSGRAKYVYDDYGNQVGVWYYDKNGEVLSDSGGIASTVKTYNVMGDCVREVFYDSNDQAISGSSGYAVCEMIYDAAGRVIQYNYFDKNGKPMSQESGCPASISYQWNDMGYLTEEIAYNETGEYFVREDSVVRIVNAYDPGGICTVQQHYDAQDQLIDTSVMIVYVSEVMEGSQAELAGVQENDIILQYDDWSLFSYESFDIVNFDELGYAITESGDRSKNVLVCKTNDFDNGVFAFQEYTFEAGLTGVFVGNTWLDLEVVEQMREQYQQWRMKTEKEMEISQTSINLS